MVCAHGGDASSHPPNSATALEAALLLGADCIELDVSLTLDGHLVALHSRDMRPLLAANGEQGAEVGSQTEGGGA